MQETLVADVLNFDGIPAVASKLFIDQLIWTPIVFLPVLFGGMVLMAGVVTTCYGLYLFSLHCDFLTLLRNVGKGFEAAKEKVARDLGPSMTANWKVV